MIKVENITKEYKKTKAIDDISFEIKNNEIVGLLGVNGAGKTTTMNMLSGYIEPTKGIIEINGYNLSKDAQKAKKEIGYMPENFPTYKELKVREFLQYMCELRDVEKKEINKNIDEVLNKLNINDIQNKLIKSLSKGYRQRVSLAGTLVFNPKIIILDEPMSGLDPKQILEIRDIIKELKKEHTIIISSHILTEITKICDKVIIINKGKIAKILDINNEEDNLEEIFMNIINQEKGGNK